MNGSYTLRQNRFEVNDLDIKSTVESAQPITFLADYDFENGTLAYVSAGRLIKCRFRGNGKICRVGIECKDAAFARKDFIGRFRLKDDMEDIYSNIATDSFITSSIKHYRGMRLTLNDPWETTFCFIVSQYNNIKRIRRIVKRFMNEFGHDVFDENNNIIAKGFPTSEELMQLSENDFRRCGVGFRARYIKEAVECCTYNIDLYSMRKRSYDRIKNELMEISGIGEKVADCIALMGYGKMEAFPIDVWVKRTLERVYFSGKNKKINELREFVEQNWSNKYLGYVQQYMFWGGRNMMIS